MKSFPKLMALGLALVLSAACHLPISGEPGPDGLEKYQSAVNSWSGAEIEELAAAWPRSWFKGQAVLADDSVVYSFIWTEKQFRPAEQYFDHANNEWVEKTSAGTELLICETKFTVGPEGLITGVRPGSYHCGQTAPPPSRPR